MLPPITSSAPIADRHKLIHKGSKTPSPELSLEDIKAINEISIHTDLHTHFVATLSGTELLQVGAKVEFDIYASIKLDPRPKNIFRSTQ